MTREHCSDEQLIAQCRAGDQGAFDALVRRYITGLYDVCFRLLRSQADAEDAVQEAFVTAFGRIDAFRGESAFRTWLYRIATNKALDALRKRKSRRTLVAYSSELHDQAALQEASAPSQLTTNPERQVLQRLETDVLWERVNDLPARYRTVLLLFYRRGLTYDQIGEVLKLPRRTVETRLYRARQQLRDLYRADKGGEQL